MFEKNTERRGIPGGLRTQLLLGLVLLVVGTMALVALVGAHLTRREVERAELDRTAADVRTLADLHRSEAARDVVASFRTDAELAYGWFRDGEETTSYGSPPEAFDREAVRDRLPAAEGEPAVGTVSIGGEPYAAAVVASPTSAEGNEPPEWHAGAVRSLQPARERVSRARQMLWAYLGIDALFILIVGYAFFTYVVVRPIRAIGVATERAARGDLASHIEVLPPNEFGRVGRSFNRMLDELRENRRELQERLEELDEAYRELEQTQESLIRSEKMASVGQLAAGVAHEIGNPLSAIAGYLELLDEMDPDDPDHADLVERMQDQVDRMQSIIGDLLAFSRDDSDQPIEAVSLDACADAAIDLLAPQPRSRGIEVSAEIPDDLAEVRGNRDQIVQVLINLLMNAADAIKREGDSGHIDLEAEARDATVVLEVTDDGAGIVPEERERIFDPFYTTKDPGEGTGLGLAIAHRIMDRFGGSIDVESTPGEGTTFRLEFERAGEGD